MIRSTRDAALCLILLAAAPRAAAQTYQAITLGHLGGGYSVAFGVNEQGTVVGGSANAQGVVRAFVWQNGVMTDLGTLPGHQGSQAYSINNFDVIVGESETGVNDESAVLWRKDLNGDWQIENLGTLGGLEAVALRISDGGEIVGYSQVENGGTHAFRWSDGAMSDLGTLTYTGASAYSSAQGINDAGQAVGFTFIPATAPQLGFIHDGNVQTSVTPNGATLDAAAINNSGAICGTLNSPQWTNALERAATRDPLGGWRVLGLPATFDESYAFDINNVGHVVGTAVRTAPFAQTAFAYLGAADGSVVELNAVTTGLLGPMVEAWDVSNSGYIAGIMEVSETSLAVLLRPSGLACPGDLTGDGLVNETDLGLVLSNWRLGSGGDLTGDGQTDEADLGVLLQAWGNDCP